MDGSGATPIAGRIARLRDPAVPPIPELAAIACTGPAGREAAGAVVDLIRSSADRRAVAAALDCLGSILGGAPPGDPLAAGAVEVMVLLWRERQGGPYRGGRRMFGKIAANLGKIGAGAIPALPVLGESRYEDTRESIRAVAAGALASADPFARRVGLYHAIRIDRYGDAARKALAGFEPLDDAAAEEAELARRFLDGRLRRDDWLRACRGRGLDAFLPRPRSSIQIEIRRGRIRNRGCRILGSVRTGVTEIARDNATFEGTIHGDWMEGSASLRFSGDFPVDVERAIRKLWSAHLNP